MGGVVGVYDIRREACLRYAAETYFSRQWMEKAMVGFRQSARLFAQVCATLERDLVSRKNGNAILATSVVLFDAADDILRFLLITWCMSLSLVGTFAFSTSVSLH